MRNWRRDVAGLLFLGVLAVVAPAQAFDILDVRYFRENGYRSCQRCDLTLTNLEGADLYGASLPGAGLGGANLQDTDLVRADLRGADLRGTNLQDAELSDANLQDAELPWVNLQNADLYWTNLQGADLIGSNLHGAVLHEATLEGANLVGADLQGARLRKANLSGVDLHEATLEGAYLGEATLEGAELGEANLQGADLYKANLRGTDLRGANLGNARLSYVNLANAIYAPASSPPNGHVAGIRGLVSVVIPTPGDLIGLVQLRKLLQEAGLPEEREATYAIERNKTRHLLFREFHRDQGGQVGGKWVGFRWDEPRSCGEGAFRWIAFEWPVAYGLRPGRALWVLVTAISGFGLVYFIALVTETGSIYRVWPAGRIEPLLGTELAAEAKAEPLLLWRSWWALPWGLWFSALSAFHLGFRELNVGNWLARVQAREYGLQAVGWVRVVAGLQSLLSVYLLAMWVLTYFGRPFG